MLLFALGLGIGYLTWRYAPVSPPGPGSLSPLTQVGDTAPASLPGLSKATGAGMAGGGNAAGTREQGVQASGTMTAGPAPGLSTSLPGSLVWPADGLVVATAGWRRHPERGDWRYLPGLELAVPSQAPVRAAAAGTVRSVDVQSDGFTVVLDHGQGWSTTYGRLSSVRVERAQGVTSGTIIGYGPRLPEVVPTLAGVYGVGGATQAAGEPGASIRAVISFAVYHGTESVDPLAVMPAASYRVAGPDEPEAYEPAGAGEPSGPSPVGP